MRLFFDNEKKMNVLDILYIYGMVKFINNDRQVSVLKAMDIFDKEKLSDFE